jgi:hypothetical protein
LEGYVMAGGSLKAEKMTKVTKVTKMTRPRRREIRVAAENPHPQPFSHCDGRREPVVEHRGGREPPPRHGTTLLPPLVRRWP